MQPITFSVSYTLSEYLSFVQEHAAVIMAQQAAAKGKPRKARPSAFTRSLIATFASVMFFVKKRRMPVCEFTIDEHHITRRTAEGQLVLPWLEVVAVHRYSQGYLIEKRNGAMPLPHRCLSPQQASTLGTLIERRQRDLRRAT